MFYKVRVVEEHCSFLRFLWWESDSSTYVLKIYFIDYEVKNNKKGEENLEEGFYVDDLLQSVHNVEKSKVLVKDAIEICAEGGFKWSKFTSNNMKLLELIPE